MREFKVSIVIEGEMFPEETVQAEHYNLEDGAVHFRVTDCKTSMGTVVWRTVQTYPHGVWKRIKEEITLTPPEET